MSFLASVFLGKDIRTGTDVALKIGHADHMPSRLHHEYDVYKTIAGSTGVSSVHWFGKEGLYKVIVLDYLRTSLGDLISRKQSDHSKVFSYAPHMVCVIYIKKKLTDIFLAYIALSNQVTTYTTLHPL